MTVWNTKQLSTTSVELHPVKSEPTKQSVTGLVIAGLFKGLHVTTTFTFALVTKAGCLSTSLKEVSVSGGPVVTKQQAERVTTGSDGADGVPQPNGLWAATVHVYVLPADNPITTMSRLATGTRAVAPPSLETQLARKG